MNKYSFILILLLTCLSARVFSQKERKFIREGNDLFEDKKFENSEVLYRKALEKKDKSFAAGFNLGDALFKQKKYDEALTQFEDLAAKEKNPSNLSKIYHNIGNTLLMKGKVNESIEAYKESLRNYPDSKETKYNLEYARHLKKEQQQQQQQQSKDQEKEGDKNKKKEDQDQKNEQDSKNKQQQNKQDQNEKDEDKAKQQEGKISKEDAERLLEALQNDEKKTQEKVQKALAKQKKAKRAKIEKDW